MAPKTSPRFYSKIAGILYLLIIVFSLVAQVFVRDRLVDYGDATLTAKNINASEFLFRFGFVSELLMLVCDTIVTMILYILLQKVSRSMAILSTLFRLLSISILSLTALGHYASVIILKGTHYLTGFSPGQQNALALLSLKLHGSGYNISLFFFAFHLICLGYLIVKSSLFPKTLGFILEIGALCYIINSLSWFLFPAFVTVIYPAILLPCFLAELYLCLWLLFKGVNVTATNLT